MWPWAETGRVRRTRRRRFRRRCWWIMCGCTRATSSQRRACPRVQFSSGNLDRAALRWRRGSHLSYKEESSLKHQRIYPGAKWISGTEVFLEWACARRIGAAPQRLHCYFHWALRRGVRRRVRTRQPAELRSPMKGSTRAGHWVRDSKAARVETDRYTIWPLEAGTISRTISESASGFHTISLARLPHSRRRIRRRFRGRVWETSGWI